MKKYKSRSGVVTVSRDARYNLRAVRVGEASHPGPGSRIRSMDRAEESDLETESLVSAPVSVDVAQEEHVLPTTVPASGVLRAAGPAEVIPMFDGSADGSEHEVDAARVGRRRFVLVSQGSHVSQSGEGRLTTDFMTTTALMEFQSCRTFPFFPMFLAHCPSTWIPADEPWLETFDVVAQNVASTLFVAVSHGNSWRSDSADSRRESG